MEQNANQSFLKLAEELAKAQKQAIEQMNAYFPNGLTTLQSKLGLTDAVLQNFKQIQEQQQKMIADTAETYKALLEANPLMNSALQSYREQGEKTRQVIDQMFANFKK